MKKNYITPEINVIQPESLLCSGGFMTASVYKESTNGECISNFDVVNEEVTKTQDLWGSNKWGDD